jgi:TfoX/Sxy family transcriptional regulator of competence genes
MNTVACTAVAMQDGYTRTVSGQKLRQYVPSAAATNATTEEFLFSMWSVPRCYKQGTDLELSFVRKCVKKKDLKLNNLHC